MHYVYGTADSDSDSRGFRIRFGWADTIFINKIKYIYKLVRVAPNKM